MKNKRPIYTIANWKMHFTLHKSQNVAFQILQKVRKQKVKGNMIVCPSMLHIQAIHEVLKKSKIKTGAQNIFHQEKGAFTGESSAFQVKSCGAKYVIVGHSERRVYFKETDLDVNKKVLMAQKYQLTPIICVGEKWEERQVKKTAEVIRRQLKIALDGVDLFRIIIAYEPVWAISSFQKGKKKIPATPKDAAYVHSYIRKLLEISSSLEVAQNTPIVYGGSMTASFAKDFAKEEEIDGSLVGSASQKPTEFVKICHMFAKKGRS